MNDLRVGEKKFRPELEGIRAVAAFLVAVYHIWFGSVSGGVDVFFIVSGYLITTSILSKLERKGNVGYRDYLLGLGKRLMPVAYVVISVSAIAGMWLLPRSLWLQTIPQIFSSAFYYQNWQLAFNAVDYLGQNNEASPYQHFWALSLQGQFYLTWPLLLSGVFLLATKIMKTPVRKTILTVLLVFFFSSLAYSVYITEVNQPWAYFNTFARVWEFSAGGIVALLLPYLRMPSVVALMTGWVGLFIIMFTGMLLPVSDVFPGYAALLPIAGAVLVIAAAENGHRFGVEKLLSTKPFMWFGSISYGFYLWHWPLLIYYFHFSQADQASLFAGLMIIALSVVLSYLTIRWIETPVRTKNVRTEKRGLTLQLGLLVTPVLLIGFGWLLYTIITASSTTVASEETHPGGNAVLNNWEVDENEGFLPDTVSIKQDLPQFYRDPGCYAYGENANPVKCSYGQLENPEYTLALVGGSHSGHWFPALEGLAEELSIQIDVYNKDACRFSSEGRNSTLSDSCLEWNDNVMEPLLEEQPDFIFTTANNAHNAEVPEGFIKRWAEFEGVSQIIAIRDNPQFPEDPTLCVESASIEECKIPRKGALSAEAPWETTDGIPKNVSFIEMSDYFCDEKFCYPVIGNVFVYRDTHHLSTLYSSSLSEALKQEMIRIIDEVESEEN